MRATLDFCLNGEALSLGSPETAEDPSRTLLTWLRERRGLTGTKEGCAEGDCGACTVVIAEINRAGTLQYFPTNSCILCLGALDGKEVVTVEALKNHPVQRAMVDCHGSQCGFCTPGFVMALYAHYKSANGTSAADALAGNLCRCTGYRPILEAAARAPGLGDAGHDHAEDEARRARLSALPSDSTLIGRRFLVPATVDELARFLVDHPQATILAGGTDAGLWITKQHRDLDAVAFTGRVAELKVLEEKASHFEIGAAVTYAEAYAALAGIHPDIGELLRRLGAVQVRAAGTLAGNIANGSPIGDSMPFLLALGASVTLQRGAGQRTIPLENFYSGYRKTVLQPGEFIRSVRVPKLAPEARFAAYKLSKRLDQDISAVCAAFHVAGGEARFAFGGMAATPARARNAEKMWSRGVEAACAALADDFKPLSDQRASAWYRLTAAQNLLRKFAMGISSTEILRL
jgi:xanthine dehydrogenase small subunit